MDQLLRSKQSTRVFLSFILDCLKIQFTFLLEDNIKILTKSDIKMCKKHSKPNCVSCLLTITQ